MEGIRLAYRLAEQDSLLRHCLGQARDLATYSVGGGAGEREDHLLLGEVEPIEERVVQLHERVPIDRWQHALLPRGGWQGILTKLTGERLGDARHTHQFLVHLQGGHALQALHEQRGCVLQLLGSGRLLTSIHLLGEV